MRKKVLNTVLHDFRLPWDNGSANEWTHTHELDKNLERRKIPGNTFIIFMVVLQMDIQLL